MKLRLLFLAVIIFPISLFAAKYNAYGLKFYTVETDHFTINYMDGCGHLVKEVGAKFEELYSIYRKTYGLTLPNKTNVMILDSDNSNGWAFANINTITLWTHDFDYNLRGSHDWFNDVITHEFAHIVSISSSLKAPPQIPEIRFGFFSHPNEKNRVEAIHSFPTDVLPPWFTEGIAQYESSKNGTDTWDSHRDMILRTLSLSNSVLSWDHMQAFAGRGDDYEKTYNHGFSLVKYIAETYGYDKIPAMLRASSKFTRFSFDKSIREVLGISGKQLYTNWKKSLAVQYDAQLKNIGTQVYGKKINKDGYENFYPNFSADGKNIFFLSNGKSDFSRKNMYEYAISDTIKDENKIKLVKNIRDVYDIHYPSGRICFTSPKSRKSVQPANLGGSAIRDLFTDTLPSDKKGLHLFQHKTEKQVTIQKDIFSASFSPKGNVLACAQRDIYNFNLVLIDTAGKTLRTIYPIDSSKNDIHFIYTVDWAPEGSQIAFSYFDTHDRKIAIYDTLKKTCDVVCNTDGDERDPRFSPDGKYLYFSSDRTGVFNIYRYELATGTLEQVTNVSGGAYAPSISPDNRQLVYAGYDKKGYSIYLIDKITSINKVKADSTAPALVQKGYNVAPPCSLSISNPRKYSRVPRQLMLVPTFIAEQSATDDKDVNQGKTTFKTGLIFNLLEPLTLSGMGNEIGGYFLVEPKHFIFDFTRGGFNPDASYDLGGYYRTQTLPLTYYMEYNLRGIAGVDSFYSESEEATQSLPYNVQIQNLNLQFSHVFGGADGSNINQFQDAIALHLLTSVSMTEVNLLLDNTTDFKYTLDWGFRFGTMGTMQGVIRNAHKNISPEGMVAKLQYTFNTEFALKDENSFNNQNQERFDKYEFHEVKAHLKTGIPSPWYAKHDLHFDINGAAISKLGDKNIPSFLLPVAWVPGYSYYYRSKKNKSIQGNSDTLVPYDTLVVTGNAVLNGEASYRFPLWPGLIDKKIGIFYLERLYGAINVSGGAGFQNAEQFLEFNRKDWLVSYGCELRLEAQTFSSYPLAIRIRYDRGIDRDAPIGGERYSFSLGYDFDNWGMVLSPDYRSMKK